MKQLLVVYLTVLGFSWGVFIPLLAEESKSSQPIASVAPEITSPTEGKEAAPKLLIKPGQSIVSGMQTEDIVVTDDVILAKEQVAAYPDSPEASFILAVALTRTSMVEEALKEIRRARHLADKQGGPAYFDHMISLYEEMLKSYPNDNRVRYGLAWAYYMKAYLLGQHAKIAVSTQSSPNQAPAIPPISASMALPLQTTISPNSHAVPVTHIPGALDHVSPEVVPQMRKYYESALKNLDNLLARQPNDIWARVYRAFLKAEYTGNLAEAMTVWQQCQAKAPDNPAPYFFLGEGYLREGNLKECLQNVSKAIALRALGK